MPERSAEAGDPIAPDPLVALILSAGDAVLWQTSYADGSPSVYCCVVGGKEVSLRTQHDYLLLLEGGVQLRFTLDSIP